jgi:hypothetical protein
MVICYQCFRGRMISLHTYYNAVRFDSIFQQALLRVCLVASIEGSFVLQF